MNKINDVYIEKKPVAWGDIMGLAVRIKCIECGDICNFWTMYKCFYCGYYYCDRCGAKHFKVVK